MKLKSTEKFIAKRTKLFALCLMASVLVTLASSAFLPIREGKIYEGVIRLHVIANSDSDTDQSVKYRVRDAILAEAQSIFDGKNMEEAATIARSSDTRLAAIAERVLGENGLSYGVRVIFGEEDYPTREYDGVTFPAGRYLSLRVVLGEGEGQNWWCVLFPPLCLGSSAVIIKSVGKTAKSFKSDSVKFKFKLKILEWFG